MNLLNAELNRAAAARETAPLVQAEHVRVVYYPTVAVNRVNISIARGTIVALVGANGAGKSTLIKALSGIVRCEEGELLFDGKKVDLQHYSPGAARSLGIRVVHQELSLCKNLTVYENFFIEQAQSIKNRFGWRKQAKEMAKAALDSVFPGNGIDVSAGLNDLSIAQQQMVEIARATSDPNMRLLILDEPTSSLPIEQTLQLQQYLIRTAREGMTYIYISHRLKEIMSIADSVFLMQNGNEKWRGRIDETSEEHMVKMMGEGVEGAGVQEGQSARPAHNAAVGVSYDCYSTAALHGIRFSAEGGQILGLTGLEGNGQLDLLQEIFRCGGKKHGKPGVSIRGRVAYVAGDRKKEGIFPLWSILENQVITKAAGSGMFRYLGSNWLGNSADYWYDKLRIKSNGTAANITSLSGGNQQKVLIARALVADADIILLDDPTRGVDQPTKNALYALFHEAAASGKLVVWRTSDDAELRYCTDLLVLNSGHIVGSFDNTNVSHETIISLSFESKDDKCEKIEVARRRRIRTPLYTFSLIALIVIYTICSMRSPLLLSKYGFQLMVVGFAALVLCALGQTFIIGLGHVDLGVGYFCGLINVVCCTLLYDKPLYGVLYLLGAFLAYPLMGYVIHKRRVPAIIVTLGMSFIWYGLALSLQSMPGGTCPAWIRTVFYTNTPVLNTLVVWLAVFIALAVLIYRSRYGTVLRGFGNNETAMVNSGWSRAKAYMSIYGLAGAFAFMAGILTSSINNASDPAASGTYTVLSVAAVIIGGGYFSGGVVTLFGAVCGAVSLSMIGVLLGLLKVSTDFTASIQGLVLILILSLRLLKRKGSKV